MPKSKSKATPSTSGVKSSKSTPDPAILEQLSKPISSPSRGFPSVPAEASKYKPLPYTFRVPGNAISFQNPNGMVRCPPFYIQLDHTLAVIWSLFSSEENDRPLGVVQLQWALSFLNGLRNQQGGHPEDIEVCINVMEEALIAQYAAMATSVKTHSASCSSCCGDGADESSQDDSQLIMQGLPFSVNYAEMSKCRPNHLEKLFTTEKGVSMSEIDIERELDRLKRVVSSHVSEGQMVPSSKENMVEFLKSFRREQINKIQEELRRLHSIETFITNIDKDNFEPYLNPRQMEQMDVLTLQKADSTPTTSEQSEASKST